MGVDNSTIKIICAAKSMNIDFSRVLTIGRQQLFLDKNVLQHIFSLQGIDVDAATFLQENKYSEKLFNLFGAQEVASLDYSSYEGADTLHDMNLPIPGDLCERFSVVFDGGCLEHIFNIPQGLKNCMEMVEVGGYFLQVTNANNFMGHGFWQLSPELLFRVFSPENGFETKAVLLHETSYGGSWYSVSDPDHVHERVELCNNSPTYLIAIAKRISNPIIFAKQPQQSDYSALWGPNATEERNLSADTALNRTNTMPASRQLALRSYLPEPVKRALRTIREEWAIREESSRRSAIKPFARSYYRVLSEDNLLRGLLN